MDRSRLDGPMQISDSHLKKVKPQTPDEALWRFFYEQAENEFPPLSGEKDDLEARVRRNTRVETRAQELIDIFLRAKQNRCIYGPIIAARKMVVSLMRSIGIPMLTAAIFGTVVGLLALNGIQNAKQEIEERIEREKENIRNEIRREIDNIIGTAQEPGASPASSALSATKSSPAYPSDDIDVEAFTRHVLYQCQLPDRGAVFRIMLDGTLTDQEKVRAIAEMLLNDERNRVIVQDAIREAARGEVK